MTQLERRIRQFEAVIECMAGGLLAADNHGHLIFANTQAKEIFGSFLLGSRTDDWTADNGVFEIDGVTPVLHDKLPLVRALRGEPITERHMTLRIDGVLRHVSMTATPLVNAEGEQEGVILVAHDITERLQDEARQRLLEEKLMEAQKLESLAVLAGGVAHDFNNLLVGILGNVELARSRLPENDRVSRYLEDALIATHRAADLCRQMLAYSGRGQFVSEGFDLGALVTETAHLLRASMAPSVQLAISLGEDVLSCEGDVTQIRQVVMNLITNAAEAIGRNQGTLSLFAETVAVEDEGDLVTDLEPGVYRVLKVADTGTGMDAETQARMFEPFFTTKPTGRGLGLAAAQGIARSHKGALRVDSQVGQGTIVSLYLPASGVVQDTAVELRTVQDTPDAGLILVIDDEPIVRAVATRTLERHGFEVIEAPDGPTGLAHLEQHRDAVRGVILDMVMPGWNGREVFIRLRQVRSDLPIVLSSGFDVENTTHQLVKEGASTFVRKPYTPADLMQAVRTVL